ncbi:MAG: outer membrane protein assembly factor BamD [Proteobacteria bacterium]|nr:outer membrane protein assembly factor BamD [Pseudomonadota bacterium]
MHRVLIAMALAFSLVSQPALAGPKDDDMSANQRFERGKRFAKRGYYTKALEDLNRVRNYHRDDPVSVLAELEIADLYYRKGDHEQAKLAYQDFIRLHPRHDRVHYVTFRLGMSTYKRASKYAGRDQSSTRAALSTWASFGVRFPDSEHREEVEELIQTSRDRLAAKELFVARFYARESAWPAVQGRTSGLVSRYPDSKHVPTALSLLGEAYHAWGMVSEAEGVRDRLAEDFAGSQALGRLERALEGEPGAPEAEAVFVRPYRIPGGGAPSAPQQ